MKRHPVATYFVLAYACSWVIAVPLALQAQGISHTHLSFALHYLTAFGPALAAFATALIVKQSLGERDDCLVSRCGYRLPWWIVGFGSPLAMFAAHSSSRGLLRW